MCPTSRRMVRRRGARPANSRRLLGWKVGPRPDARASGVFWLIGVRRRALDAPTVLRLARLPEVAMLPAAEVAAAVGRDDARHAWRPARAGRWRGRSCDPRPTPGRP